jgi:hypothetical protein
VTKIGKWVAKFVTHLLASAALWFRIQISLKNTKWATYSSPPKKYRIQQQNIPPQEPREHGVLEGEAVVFILSDQNFPPAMPSKNNCECLRIIRGEHASLGDLFEIFLEIFKGFEIRDGTIVVLSSATHLGHARLEIYAHELRNISKKFSEIFGQAITVVPGIPVLLDGSDQEVLDRMEGNTSTLTEIS